MTDIILGARSGSGDCNVDWTPPPSVPTNPPVSTTTPRQTTSRSTDPPPSNPTSTSGATTERTTKTPGKEDWRRTVVFLRAFTQPGNNLFYAGGIGHDRRPGKVQLLDYNDLQHNFYLVLQIANLYLQHLNIVMFRNALV